ncbi:hypothetical protein D3C71_25140 [compost metagenome]
MLWAALLPNPALFESRPSEVLRGISTWCLQFTPRVALVDEGKPQAAVVMEVESSVRLFGGKRRLVETVRAGAGETGLVEHLAWAPTSLAAVAVGRRGLTNGFAKSLEQVLDALPLDTLLPVARHAPTLARTGCKTLGDVRALPRGGLSRRFDKDLLLALDQAYGLRPEAHLWQQLAETFEARLELMSRVELAPALLFGARRLLQQLCAWLTARRAGVRAITLRWCHDVMRSKAAGEGGELTVRTAQTTRDIEHLARLLAEHLAKVQLDAPVGDLVLAADEVLPLEETSSSFLPDAVDRGETLDLVLERIAARLGPERVLRPLAREDHRPEWMAHWQPAAQKLPRLRARAPAWPQPTFLLDEPMRLACKESVPLYQGPLLLLMGPHRVEFGWYDLEPGQSEETRFVQRDYWVAYSEHAGLLYVYQTRLAHEEAGWFLQGVFA